MIYLGSVLQVETSYAQDCVGRTIRYPFLELLLGDKHTMNNWEQYARIQVKDSGISKQQKRISIREQNKLQAQLLGANDLYHFGEWVC